MADALLSEGVGIGMWGISAGALAVACRGVRTHGAETRVPLMGVLGAFVFAAQMVNFPIPLTGSSGHLGGGLLLAVLLGPAAATVVLTSILVVQALFFADGGLLALGANVFNIAVLPCGVVYPLLFRLLGGESASRARRTVGTVLTAVVAAELGALAVVLETVASGIAELPFRTFLAFMLPVHVVIGFIEGLVTAGVLAFVERAQPLLLRSDRERPERAVTLTFLALALLAGCLLAGFASTRPDGLEWSVERTSSAGEERADTGAAAGAGGSSREAPAGGLHDLSRGIQESTSVLPDYGLPDAGGEGTPAIETAWAGLVGGAACLLIALALGALLARRGRRGLSGVDGSPGASAR